MIRKTSVVYKAPIFKKAISLESIDVSRALADKCVLIRATELASLKPTLLAF